MQARRPRDVGDGHRATPPPPPLRGSLRDPMRLAQWLLEAHAHANANAPTTTTAAAPPAESSTSGSTATTMTTHATTVMATTVEDEDEGEDVDEDDEGHLAAANADADASDNDNDNDNDNNDDEDSARADLATLAAALELTQAVAQQLHLRMLLAAGEQMHELERLDRGDDAAPGSSSSVSSSVSTRLRAHTTNASGVVPTAVSAASVGVPRVHARAVPSPSCAHCRRSFSAFQRSRCCPSCGFTFCPKCLTSQQRLPRRFGFGDQIVKVCEPCSTWFQGALDRYLDAMHLVPSASVPPMGPLSPLPMTRSERAEYRRQRHSIATPDRPQRPARSWFSGNLRAMHMGDRQPRRKSTSEFEAPIDKVGADETPVASVDTREEAGATASTKHNAETPASNSLGPEPPHSPPTAVQPPSASPFSVEEGKGSTHGNADIDQSVLPLTINLCETAPPDDISADSLSRLRSTSKPARLQTSKRAKLLRSASFDITNLRQTHLEPPPSPSAISVANSDAGESVRSGVSIRSEHTSANGKKCFDDSDIVDEHRQFQSEHLSQDESDSDVRSTCAVLRFAVYDVGNSETQHQKRSLVRFGRKNVHLNRYTLEVDCSQGIVRVKSVFMHRFWSFRCEAVREIDFQNSSSNGAVARVVVVKHGGHGTNALEWEFATDDERLSFQQTVDKVKSRVLDPIQLVQHRVDRVIESSPQLGTDDSVNRSDQKNSANSEAPKGEKITLFVGERIVGPTVQDIPATLVIGPIGDTMEASTVWGRIRGFLTVTTYRVLFMPLEKGRVPYRSSTYGAISYVPLFAITSSQVMYPGGRRTKSARSNPSSLSPPALVILCKDARAMRIEIEGPVQAVDERTQFINNAINKVVDAAQRNRQFDIATAINSPPELSLDGSGNHGKSTNGDPTATLPSISIKTSLSEDCSPRGGLEIAASPLFLPSTSTPSTPTPINGSTKLERSDIFAFSFSLKEPISTESNGWNVYSDEREFKRQISADPSAQPFLRFYQNGRGTICPSYPAKLLVPSSMNSSTLGKVADFRAKNRLPVVTYYHHRHRCVLVRSGQPLLGSLLSGTSSLSDQLLVGTYRRLPEIITAQSHSAPSSRPIYIFDARKLKASTGNRIIGKGGVETPQDYPGAVIYHLNIANMYRMQSSYQSLIKLVVPGGVDDGDKSWLSSLEATNWLNHVRLVLDGAVKISRVLELEGSSVLVHCSDGWDRTAQLCALAQLMIDPFYRTIRGFAVLVEKDWCAFGHKFSERLGGDRNKDPNRHKSSPVMYQFLDAVWQIQCQFPNAFEFNERFLLHIANSLTSGLYGTFLYDSRLQRETNRVDATTVSVWTPVLMTPQPYVNPQYVRVDKPIWPWTTTQMMRLWEAYFFQWHPKFHDCRWISSLVHHSECAHPGTTRSSAEIATSSQEMSEPPATPRDRQGSGDITGSRSNGRTQRQQPQQSQKTPPMHKIFLFKS